MSHNRMQFDSADDADPTLRPSRGGMVFLLRWFGETWGEAVRERMGHLAFLYIFMLLGFVGLYVTMKSTAKWVPAQPPTCRCQRVLPARGRQPRHHRHSRRHHRHALRAPPRRRATRLLARPRRLSELRRNVASVLREQRQRKFDEDSFRSMPGGGMYF
jgi:hypothetical protein